MEKNSQRVIMISGANRGIGKAIREKLQSENYLLSLGLRNPGASRDAMENHESENIHLHKYDARNPESAESWVRSTLEHFGKICLLYTSPSPRDYAASRMPSSA